MSIAHQIGAADVDVLFARRIEADHFRAIAFRLDDQFLGDNPLAQDAAVVIYVVEKKIDRLDALQQAGFEVVPFVGGDRAGNQIERENFLNAAAVRVHREGDSLVDEDEIGVLAARLKIGHRQLPQPMNERLAMIVRLQGPIEQLVPRG